MYPMTLVPYVVLVILAIVFRRTVPGATISLLGALALGGFGVFTTYTAKDEMTIALLPYVLLAGSGLLLLAQLVMRKWRIG